MMRGGRVELGCLEDNSLGVLLLILALLAMRNEGFAWVAPGPKRQSDVTASAPKAAKDAPVVHEGASADLAPMQAPQPPHAAPTTMPQRIA
ncbi:hypothetical protein Tco_0014385 [Tanacetum coccineum]